MNLYLIAGRPSISQNAVRTSANLEQYNLRSNAAGGFFKTVILNGTVLVTDKMVAAAPINFYITYNEGSDTPKY